VATLVGGVGGGKMGELVVLSRCAGGVLGLQGKGESKRTVRREGRLAQGVVSVSHSGEERATRRGLRQTKGCVRWLAGGSGGGGRRGLAGGWTQRIPRRARRPVSGNF